MVVQYLVGVVGYLAAVVYDKSAEGCGEYHGALRALLGTIPCILHLPLVRVELGRIFQWEHVVWTSFIAGIIQTLLYADFIYYFVKANQQDRILNFPV